MGAFSSVFDFLIKKHPVIFLISVLTGLLSLIIVPKRIILYVPFPSFSVKLISCCIVVGIVTYLLLSFANYIVKIIKEAKDNSDQSRVNSIGKESINQVKSEIDKWDDFGYSVVMFLLDRENKIPYVNYGFRQEDSILDNERMFDICKSNRNKKIVKKLGISTRSFQQ